MGNVLLDLLGPTGTYWEQLGYTGTYLKQRHDYYFQESHTELIHDSYMGSFRMVNECHHLTQFFQNRLLVLQSTWSMRKCDIKSILMQYVQMLLEVIFILFTYSIQGSIPMYHFVLKGLD